MTTYSRDNAYLRFHYDETHPNAYGYLFEPTGGFGGWVGARPGFLNVHGGGFAQPGYDEDNERDSSQQMVQSSATLDAFADAGAAIIVLEYPLGTHPGDRSGRGVACTKFPETWQVLARAIQYIKDQAATGSGGIFDGLIDPDDIGALVNSAGAMAMMFVQWTPESWGMFPRAPGSHVALGNVLPLSSPRLKAMVMTGPPPNTRQADPSRAISGSYGPLPVVLASPLQYRPLISFVATMANTVSVGDRVENSVDTTVSGEVKTLTLISGASYTVEMLVEGGTTTSLTGTEVMQVVGAATNTLTLTAAPTILDQHGWLEIPTRFKEAMSPILLLDECTEADLVEARTCAVYATIGTNPSVQFNTTDDEHALKVGKYGVDDGYDIPYIAHKLSTLTGFTVETYWGEDASTLASPRLSQQITAATAASPIVITTGERHGIQTGDLIQVGQGVGLTGMSGNFTATRISETTFSLQGSTGTGTYTGSGVWCFRNTGANLASGSSAAAMVAFCRDDAGMALA